MAMPDLSHLTRPADDRAKPAPKPATSDSLRAKPGKPFWFVFYPKQSGNWAYLEIKAGEGVPEDEVGWWWLCVPQRVEENPGVGGFRTIKAGQPPEEGHRRAHEQIARKGGIVVPKEFGYEVAIECYHPVNRRPGHIFVDVWSKPLPQLDDERITFDFDHQRFRRWLLALHRSGFVPEMDPRIAVKHTARLANRVERRAGLLQLPEEQRKKHVENAAKELEQVASARRPKDPPEAKPKRGRATPTEATP